MKTTCIVLLALLAFVSVNSLPRLEQLALVNSLEVGREQDPNLWQCAGCSAQNKPISTHIVQEDVQAVRAIVSIYEDYTVLGFRYTANAKNIWQDLLWAIQVQDQHSCIGCKVQKQYENMWNSILDQTFEDLEKTHLTKRLIITGISLGGALAQLAFVDIYNRQFFQDVQVVTFGSPRVGNEKWANWFNDLTVSERLYIKGDPIPALPACLTFICNYKQTERPIVCNKNTKICKVKNQQEETFINPLLTAGLMVQGMKEVADLYMSNQLNQEGGILDHIFGYKKIIDYTLEE